MGFNSGESLPLSSTALLFPHTEEPSLKGYRNMKVKYSTSPSGRNIEIFSSDLANSRASILPFSPKQEPENILS